MKSVDERLERTNEVLDMKKVMTDPAGARVLERILRHCRVGRSVWAPGVEIHYNAGAQDVGHFIQDEMNYAKELNK